MEMVMKLATHSMRHQERFNCVQQIAAHIGGMSRAFMRHYPVNWRFHWNGICRAISSERLIGLRGQTQSAVRCISDK
jgi:hypothetical protein